MVAFDQQEGGFRVVLVGVGNNSEEEKNFFCQNISKDYRIPFADLRKIVDRCPVVLKKNLSLRKAEIVARAFTSFGGLISIEEKTRVPVVSLEFQELNPHQLALESSYAQKSPRGTWSVTGRARNISDGTLSDTWVLIQLFRDSDEFIAFEEAPLAINPLPSGQISPFRVIFEEGLAITKISIAFKNASGQPIPAVDKRKKKESARTDKGEEQIPSFPRISPVLEEKSEVIQFTGPLEMMLREEEKEPSETIPLPLGRETEPDLSQERRQVREDAGGTSEEFLLLPVKSPEETLESSRVLLKGGECPAREESNRSLEEEPAIEELGGEAEGRGHAPGEDRGIGESHLGVAVFQEASQLLKEISGTPEEEECEEKTDPSLSWIEHFRDAVETFYQTSRDAFSPWFEECRRKREFKNSLHGLLTILVHSRFYQGSESTKALENTQRLFQLIIQPNLLFDQIPPLEGTSFVSGEVWRDLFQKALPKLHQVGNAVLEKKMWSAPDLERMVQVIPQMGYENSQMATRWIDELIPDAVQIDFSTTRITIGEGLYRVAARLSVVNPHLDDESGNAMGDTKIHSFAMMAFPHHPAKVEKPMALMGEAEEKGGHCFPVQPWCEGCLFKTFCPKLYLDFNPSEKRMRGWLNP